MLNIFDGSGRARRSFPISFDDSFYYPFFWVSNRNTSSYWERKYYVRDENWPEGSFYTDCKLYARDASDASRSDWIQFSFDAGGPVMWQDELEFDIDTGEELVIWINISIPPMSGNYVNFETILESIEHS